VTRGVALVLVAVATSLSMPTSVVADDQSEARRLFDEGTEAIHSGHPARARDLLERSLALVEHPATVWNLILALDRSDGLMRARELCDGLLSGEYGALTDERRAEATDSCDTVTTATPELTLVGEGAPRVTFHIDGAEAGEVDDGGELTTALDPGRHVVEASVAETRGDRRSLVLERAERSRLVLAVQLPDETETPPPESGGNALPWILGGTAVAVVAAVVIVAVLLSTSGSQDPIEGDFPVTETLLGP